MVRRFPTGTVLRVALIATAAASVAACQRPKPPVDNTPPAQTQQPTTQMPPGQAPVTQQPSGPTPGSAQDFVVNVGDRVYFDTDQYDIRDDARPVLEAQAAWLRRYPGVQVRIEGNADERGTREYNLALGARRANSVRNFLVAQGVSADRIATISFGKEQPLDAGTGEEAWQRNRNAHTAIVSGAN